MPWSSHLPCGILAVFLFCLCSPLESTPGLENTPLLKSISEAHQAKTECTKGGHLTQLSSGNLTNDRDGHSWITKASGYGLVAMTFASHAKGREFDPHYPYTFLYHPNQARILFLCLLELFLSFASQDKNSFVICAGLYLTSWGSSQSQGQRQSIRWDTIR